MKKMIFSFIAGAGLGALSTYLYLNKKYDEKANKEVEEARKYYKESIIEFTNDISTGNVSEETEEAAADVVEEKYVEEVSNYIPETSIEKPKKKGGRKKKKESDAIVISSDEFVELNGYDKVTLYFFSEDKTFTDVDFQVFEEGMDIIGAENLDCPALYEDGSMYVRSDKFGTDYEIVIKYDSYRDFVGEE